MPNAHLDLRGFEETIAKLERLGDKRLLKKTARKGVTAGAQVVVGAVREQWPKDSGFSAKSVNKKIITTQVGFKAIIGTDKSASTVIDGHVHTPSKIDQLIELGYLLPNGTVVPARAPLRKGFEASKDEAANTCFEKMAAEVEKEALKR